MGAERPSWPFAAATCYTAWGGVDGERAIGVFRGCRVSVERGVMTGGAENQEEGGDGIESSLTVSRPWK